MIQPHAFKPHKRHDQCSICGGWPDAYYHNLELFSGADRERQAAFELAEAERMASEMRSPLKDISHAAGILERESPLFGSLNPTLF